MKKSCVYLLVLVSLFLIISLSFVSAQTIREKINGDGNLPNDVKQALTGKASTNSFEITNDILQGGTKILVGKNGKKLEFVLGDIKNKMALDVNSVLIYKSGVLISAEIKVPNSCGDGACPPEPNNGEGYLLGNSRIIVVYGAEIDYVKGINGEKDIITIIRPDGAKLYNKIQLFGSEKNKPTIINKEKSDLNPTNSPTLSNEVKVEFKRTETPSSENNYFTYELSGPAENKISKDVRLVFEDSKIREVKLAISEFANKILQTEKSDDNHYVYKLNPDESDKFKFPKVGEVKNYYITVDVYVNEKSQPYPQTYLIQVVGQPVTEIPSGDSSETQLACEIACNYEPPLISAEELTRLSKLDIPSQLDLDTEVSCSDQGCMVDNTI